jgi:hypothetical protein
VTGVVSAMKRKSEERGSGNHSVDARDEVRAADVELTVALVAQMTASRTAYDLADDDTRTCIREATTSYADAAWHYLNAASLALGQPIRPGHYDLACLPRPLRSALGQSLIPFRRAARNDDSTPAMASLDLDRRQKAVTLIRELLEVALPELLQGLSHPRCRLQQLRTAAAQVPTPRASAGRP